jgi:hypothetical protein
LAAAVACSGVAISSSSPITHSELSSRAILAPGAAPKPDPLVRSAGGAMRVTGDRRSSASRASSRGGASKSAKLQPGADSHPAWHLWAT